MTNKIISEMKQLFFKWWSDPFFFDRWNNERIYGRNMVSDDQKHIEVRGAYGAANYVYNSDSHHLIQDVYTGVMPYLSIRQPQPGDPFCSFSSELTPQQERFLSDGISFRDRSFRITDAVCNFIREATHHVLTYGVSYYEINYTFDEGGEITAFEFSQIPNKHFYNLFLGYLQFIPWWVAKKSQCRAGFAYIPKEKVLKISIPKELITRRRFIRTLKRLFWLTDEIFPDFNMRAMEQGKTPTFNVNLYQKGRYLEVAKLTKDFGWNQRTRQNSYFTEYYFFKRFLQAAKVNYYFRKECINSLNKFIARSSINIDAQIVMNNFVSYEEIAAWETRMLEGGLKFMDMFNALKDR